MTVGELKNKLQYYNDDAEIMLTSDCIQGTTINQDFSIQTNDGDDNSPVYIEFGLGDMTVPTVAAEARLKEIIFDLKMKILHNNIPNGNCPYAYYDIGLTGCEKGVGCGECRDMFFNEMEDRIEKEVEGL